MEFISITRKGFSQKPCGKQGFFTKNLVGNSQYPQDIYTEFFVRLTKKERV